MENQKDDRGKEARRTTISIACDAYRFEESERGWSK